MLRILFLCSGNSGRSLAARSFANDVAPKWVEITSASDKKYKIIPGTVLSMQKLGYDIPEKVEISLSQILEHPFDIVITLCNKAKEFCPIFPGSPALIHWPIQDPGSIKDSAKRDSYYIEMCFKIKERVISLFKYGYVEAIRELRLTFRSLLDHLTDGVIAHDLERKIFFMNKAAEEITGYSRREIIGHDCHEVFPGKFCGGDCSFCSDKSQYDSKLKYNRVFNRKNGDRINLEMSVVTLAPPNSKVIGVLVIFKDITEVEHLKKRLAKSRGYSGIIGQHPSMQKLFNSIRELSDVKVPILIQGDTGTGKEMVAHALHQNSKRSSGPFVPINCGALPEGTLESELFGHVRGAFTGAIHDRKGRFELAEGGTIFLDEIGEVSQAMQVKLLRVLQENCFVPVGGEKVIQANVRVICATNRDLKSLTNRGLFREDLYYRLAVVPIQLPALCERQSDIPLLIDYFLDKFSADLGRQVHEVSTDAIKAMMDYKWPGNVRELSNAMQYSMIKCKADDLIIQVEHLPPEIRENYDPDFKKKSGRPTQIDYDVLLQALNKTGGNKAKAAKLLGISRTSIYRLLQEH